MAELEISTRLIVRNDTSQNWQNTNPVLLRGEQGVETDTGKAKMGDGVNPWAQLSYLLPSAGDIPILPVLGMGAATVQEAIAENFQLVVDGKNSIEAAVNDKGGNVSKVGSIATFPELTEGIASIQGGGGNECTVTFDNYNPPGKPLKESWTALSQVRGRLVGATAGNKALFGGGLSGSLYCGAVDAYTSDGTQSSFPAFSTGRGYLAATALGGKALFGGGFGAGSASLGEVNAYTEDGERTALPSMLTKRFALRAVSLGDKAFFAGGYIGSVKSAKVDVYTADGAYATFPDIAEAKGHFAATVVGSKALFGGNGGGAYTKKVCAYSEDGSISVFPDLSVARGELTATTIGEKALFGGGKTSGSVVKNTMDAFTEDGIISAFPNLSVARCELTSCTILGKAIFAGGDSGSAVFTDLIDAFFEDGSKELLPPLSEKKHCLAGVVLEDRAIFAGGMNNSAGYAGVDAYGDANSIRIAILGGAIYNFGDGETVHPGTFLNSDSLLVSKPVNGYIKYKGCVING